MSALISGVKNFVSMGDSLVRALPVSHVKSANANGSAFAGFVETLSWVPGAADTAAGGVALVTSPLETVPPTPGGAVSGITPDGRDAGASLEDGAAGWPL